MKKQDTAEEHSKNNVSKSNSHCSAPIEAVETNTNVANICSSNNKSTSQNLQREASLNAETRTQPRSPPIQIWRQWVDPYGGGSNVQATDRNNPLGPFSIPRITRSTPKNSFPDLRFYNFPKGNDGIEDVDPNKLIPTWHAWAGWLGPRASFRVRWGSPHPIRKYSPNDLPALPRSHRSVKTLEKSFRVDYITPVSHDHDFLRTCRGSTRPSFANGDWSEDKEDTDSKGTNYPSYLSPAAVKGEPFNMFPKSPEITQLDCPYGGPLKRFTRNQVKLAVIIRCLELYLMPNGAVNMGDPIGLFLLFGSEGISYKENSGNIELEEKLD